MLKTFSLIIYLFLRTINKLFYFLTNRNFITWINYFINLDSEKVIKIREKKVLFFIPNHLTEWRVRTFVDKEPDTIDWINRFNTKKDIIFWDIGANIGVYSIYASCIHNKKIKVYAFEPSTSNLRILSRNIYLNKLVKKIIINTLPLTNKENKFLEMKEAKFEEGLSLNTFGENFDFEGKKFKVGNCYKILGTTIDYLIVKKIMEVPDYIKIDVDGIEHLILLGGKKTLKNKKIKSVLIEVNEKFLEQKNKVHRLMSSFGFKLTRKLTYKSIPVSKKFSKTYNYIYERKRKFN